VRAGFLSDQPALMRPVAAAYAAKRPEIAELLMDLGATREDDPRAGSDR
jgi:hypothetical protein